MVNEFYQGLPSNYANYEDVALPKHESMREKTRREGGYGYYNHWNKDAYTWIDRFLEDSVGKKFDNVYSKVCERFRKKKDFNFRKKFKSRIDPHNMSNVHWHRNDYYLDSNHIIRRYKSIKKNKRIKYYYDSVNKTYYERSPEHPKHYYENRDAERKSCRERKKEIEKIHEQMLIDSLIRKKVNSIVSSIISNPSIPISLGDINRITMDVEKCVKKNRMKKILN